MVDFGRVVTAMVTPFDDELQIDWKQLDALVDFLIHEQQTDSIVVSGTTGESPTLTDEEKIKLFTAVVNRVDGRCKVIAGTGSFSTAQSVSFTQEAEQTGVDGILLVAPYYNRSSEAGMYEHFSAIADATSLPIMLYNVPSRTGVNMSLQLTLMLAQIPNIVAMKESSGDLDQISEIIAHAPAGFRVYSGDDSLTLPVLSVGGYGIVSVASHVIGKEMKRMIDSFVSGDVGSAASMHGQLMPIFKGMFNCPHRVPNPAPVKFALKLKGVDVGGLRLPLVEVTEQEAAFIRSLF